ncbi:hypothetical protein [Methylobacterium nonmethylotrophicum]|uniref:Uncharacterized protein n=1 Tax=Methylobacterium nonmethylotrophicum TaxID=1141884 RepID=A0A4Z0NK93_9HYPH|nr:hypothetical protein [Methylobacterium nonmethylotrophicum]TGD96052.1 hypothetical protein EU555_25155 [Methylobacterium nonmethylotrophicum]
MRTAARAYRFGGPGPRRPERSCETRAGGTGRGARQAAEIWSQQEHRGLTARELIRLAQTVRLRSSEPAE